MSEITGPRVTSVNGVSLFNAEPGDPNAENLGYDQATLYQEFADANGNLDRESMVRLLTEGMGVDASTASGIADNFFSFVPEGADENEQAGFIEGVSYNAFMRVLDFMDDSGVSEDDGQIDAAELEEMARPGGVFNTLDLAKEGVLDIVWDETPTDTDYTSGEEDGATLTADYPDPTQDQQGATLTADPPQGASLTATPEAEAPPPPVLPEAEQDPNQYYDPVTGRPISEQEYLELTYPGIYGGGPQSVFSG